MARDPFYNRLIHSSQWTRLRRAVLSTEPLCRRCSERGIIRGATEVHHITPIESAVSHAAMARLAYDRNNLMPLCHDCHVAVHTEMGRSGKKLNRQRVAEEVRFVTDRFFSDESTDPGG